MRAVDHKEVENADAIERLFCAPLREKGATDRLSDTMTRMMLAMFMTDDLPAMKKELEGHGMWYLPIMGDRMKLFGYEIDMETELFMAVLANSPGKCVMYAFDLMSRAKAEGITKISFKDHVVEKWFPMGFYTEAAMNEAWDLQKVDSNRAGGSDNLLDYGAAAQSLIVNQTQEA